MANQPSGLNAYKIGGTVTDLCGDPIEATVNVSLLSESGVICDPTNSDVVAQGTCFVQKFEDGCWCTCPLRPNTSDAADGSLTPIGSWYHITVVAGGQTVVDMEVAVHDEDFAAITQTTLSEPCGPVVHIKDLLLLTPTIPPTVSFCDAVAACETPTTLVRQGSAVTYTNEVGTEFTIPVCDLLQALPQNAAPLPTSVRVLGSDCQMYDLPDPVIPEVFWEYTAYDALIHDAGVIEGDGTAGSPFQIPLPMIQETVEINSIGITNTVVNPDGSTTVTYTITETDDGDLDPAVHTFDVAFPASASVNMAYATFDPLVHVDGGLAGSGSVADPFQLPLPAENNRIYVPFDPLVHVDGNIIGSGTVADPYQIPLPPDVSCCVTQVMCDPGTNPDTQVALVQALDATGGISGTPTYIELPGLTPWTGDPSTLVGCTDAEAVEFTYVPFDPLVHLDGTLAGAGTAADPYQIPLGGDGAVYNYVAFDELVHVNGALVGAGTVADPYQIPLCPKAEFAYVPFDDQVHVDGPLAGAGTAADPFQVPLVDVCDEIQAFPSGVCDPNAELVLDTCETIPAADLLASHTFASILTTGETISAGAAGGDPVPSAITATELDRDIIGLRIAGSFGPADPGIPAGTFPLSIPVPAASSTDCVLALQVSYGGIQGPDPTVAGSSLTLLSGSDVSAPTKVGSSLQFSPPYGFTDMYLFDVLNTTAGSVVELDMATHIPDEGVIHWFWVELKDAALTDPLTVASFDLGNVIVAPIGTPTTPSADVDLGDCGGFYWAAARHVDNDNALDPIDTPNANTNWFGSSIEGAGTGETYDVASVQNATACQIGSAFGVVDPLAGPWNFTYTQNTAAGFPEKAVMGALALDCAAVGGGGGSTSSAQAAQLNISNAHCILDGVARCIIRASVKITADAGADVVVMPVVNGVQLADQAVGIDNTAGAATAVQTFAVNTTLTDLNVIAPGGSSTTDVEWVVVSTGGLGTAEISAWTTECEVIPV